MTPERLARDRDAQETVDAWNAAHPPGTPVRGWGRETWTVTPAYVLTGSPAVQLYGSPGAYHVDGVQVRAGGPDRPDDLDDVIAVRARRDDPLPPPGQVEVVLVCRSPADAAQAAAVLTGRRVVFARAAGDVLVAHLRPPAVVLLADEAVERGWAEASQVAVLHQPA